MPISKSSRATIFINTSPIKKRTHLLKSKKILEELPVDSTDIVLNNILHHYSKRKIILEDVCLAEYVAYYYRSNESGNDSDNDDTEIINNNIEIHRRSKARIIRYVRYKIDQDPTNYYREQVLLFMPWRNEEVEVENVNCKDIFDKEIDQIEKNRSLIFTINYQELMDIAQQVSQDRDEIRAEEAQDFQKDGIDKDQEIDIQADIGRDKAKKDRLSSYAAPQKIDLSTLHNNMRQLNEKQREIVMHIYKCFKVNNLPFKIFMSGCAGVGKSLVINTIFQIITHLLDSRSNNNNVDALKVLLCAFSGKASFLIGGNTLHSAFALPITQFAKLMPDLSSEIAGTIRELLFHVKLLIIDEISMVGSTLFSKIDTRLQQIMGKNESFGGISVLVVGDLNQIPPVFDSMIFECPKQSDLQFERSPLWEEFKYYELSEIMRQKDDLKFAQALNNLAKNKMLPEDIALLRSREVLEANVPKDTIRLYYANASVDSYNNKRIAEFPGIEYVSTAEDKVIGKMEKRQKIKL